MRPASRTALRVELLDGDPTEVDLADPASRKKALAALQSAASGIEVGPSAMLLELRNAKPTNQKP